MSVQPVPFTQKCPVKVNFHVSLRVGSRRAVHPCLDCVLERFSLNMDVNGCI